MPKLRTTEREIQDSYLRKAIKGSAGFYQLDINEQARIAGVKRATWYRRLKSPSDFSVRELRKMIARYDWDAETVCLFLGVKRVT